MHRQAALAPGVPTQPGAAARLAWVEGVSLLGMRVTAVASIDAAEHDRRLASGCGAVTDPALLGCLLGLPLGASVPDPVAWAETTDQPPAVIGRDVDGITVTRCLATPLAIEDVIAVAPAGRELRAVQDVSLFACFARRWVVTTKHRMPERVVLEAKLCGIGILGPSGLQLASEAPVTREMDAWDWMLREKVYRRWVSQSSQDRATAIRARATGEATATRTS
jgi:hypothetical protein